MGKEDKKGKKLPVSFVTGAIALVFLIVGYQVALFLNRAAISKILAEEAVADTVYVVDRALAESVLSGKSRTLSPDASQTGNINGGHDSDGSGTGEKHAYDNKDSRQEDHIVIRKDSRTGRSGIRIESEARGYRIDQRTGERYSRSKGTRDRGDTGGGRRDRTVENFRFNPNTVSAEDLQRLGFSERQARAIVNYRLKGGKFNRKSDFAKSFVVADSVYRRLEPYIDIPLLELNTADSAALDGLPGIGGYFAGKIIEYRDRLQGFSCKEQLMDIHNFDREKFDGLQDLVTISEETVTPYPMWTLPEDSLRLHPYIGSYAAHGIVLYRENNPVEMWTIEGLAEAGVLKPEMAAKLARCRIARH